METAQLVQLLESLTADERRRLKKWVRSPYFNQHEDVIRLFDFLYDPRQPYEKERAWRAVRPGGAPYDDARMRHTMSWLTEAVRQFLIFEELKLDGRRTGILLAKSLARRGLEKYADRERASIELDFANAEGRTFARFGS